MKGIRQFKDELFIAKELLLPQSKWVGMANAIGWSRTFILSAVWFDCHFIEDHEDSPTGLPVDRKPMERPWKMGIFSDHFGIVLNSN
ncbi:hypothetical protein [Haloferula sp. A504]|uniref:hypothetical protein n=1 Tax=Haloferula sp. A504 TaxID=3373601 RepID=UPI0031C1C829|nr:hypothetical protein [Verrucomicrobiaceae bacterium E54]